MKPLKTFYILILLQWRELFQGFYTNKIERWFFISINIYSFYVVDQDTARYSFCSAQEKCVSLAEPYATDSYVNSVRAYSCWICCPFYKISNSRESNYIFHSCLVSAFNISVQLWRLRDLRFQCWELYTACILSQYNWDKAFHFPGKFHFLIKRQSLTRSDSE